MKTFDLHISGDMATTSGEPVGDLGLDTLALSPHIRWAFLQDQVPRPDDPTYQERMYSMELTAEQAGQAEGIILCRPWLRAHALAKGADRLLAIGRAGIGYDKINLAACTAADVVVFNSPYGLTHATASAAMLLILACARRLPIQQRIVREGRWDRQMEAVGDDLEGLTLGIVGFGHTAIELVRLMAPFRIRVIAFSPRADPAAAARSGVSLVETIEDVFRQSDYVSLHNRLTDETRGMIGDRLLRLMKPTASFINVARGEIVDENALIRCLQERRIACAGLDVFEHEPLPTGSALLQLDNVVLAPHFLCSTRQGGKATWLGVLEGMQRVARGEVPSNVLNPDVLLRPGFRSKLARFEENR